MFQWLAGCAFRHPHYGSSDGRGGLLPAAGAGGSNIAAEVLDLAYEDGGGVSVETGDPDKCSAGASPGSSRVVQ